MTGPESEEGGRTGGPLRCAKCQAFLADSIHDYQSANPERRASAHRFKDPTYPLNRTGQPSERASRGGLWFFLGVAAVAILAAWLIFRVLG